jgi:hypothetical protein
MGPAGIGVSAVLNVILGLVSSGGLAPLEALPPFYQAYADWMPLRYVIHGLRDMWWFLGGGRSEAAGPEDAVWILGAYLAGSVTLGYVISFLADLVARRRKTEHGKEPAAAVR